VDGSEDHATPERGDYPRRRNAAKGPRSESLLWGLLHRFQSSSARRAEQKRVPISGHFAVQNGGTEIFSPRSRQTKAPPERGFSSKAPTGIEPVYTALQAAA
jgi:hypothetical protein